MRIVDPPIFDENEVYTTCVESISNEIKKNDHLSIANVVATAMSNYITKSSNLDFYQIPICNLGNDDIVTGNVTKKELKDVYAQHMVGENKPARTIYDALTLLAPQNICPFCGIGQVDTLDHYLPKAKFPLLSVLPKNLIPACSPCNKAKTTGVALTKGEQCLHPYFDRGAVYDERWLYAEVIKYYPVVIKYYVESPNNWSSVQRSRINSHFCDFKLAKKFSIQAASELSNLRTVLISDFKNGGVEAVKAELTKRHKAALENRINSWDTALYEVLAESDWYCSIGFCLD